MSSSSPMTPQRRFFHLRIKVLRIALALAGFSFLNAAFRNHADGIEGQFNAIAFPLGTLIMVVTLAALVLRPRLYRALAAAALGWQGLYLALQFYFSLFIFPDVGDVRAHLFPLASWQPLMAVFCFVALDRRRALLASAGILGPPALLVATYCATQPAPWPTKSLLIDAFLVAPATAVVLMVAFFALQQRLADAHAAAAKSEQLALTDELTELPNRRALNALLQRELARIRRHGGVLGVALLDIDRFKQINDIHGHDQGDIVLRATAQRLAAALRDSDWAGRWGGDEFLVALVATDVDGLQAASERIRAACCAPATPETPAVEISAGLAVAVAGDAAEVVVKRADAALYAAKQAGRGRVVVAAGTPTA